MAKNLAVTVNGTTIQKRNLKNVHYPNTSTNIKIVNRKIGSRSNREYWRKRSNDVTLTVARVDRRYWNDGASHLDTEPGWNSNNPRREYTVPDGYTVVIFTQILPSTKHWAGSHTDNRFYIDSTLTGRNYVDGATGNVNPNTWKEDTAYSVSPGQVLKFQSQATRNINNDDGTNGGTFDVIFHFE